MCMLCGGVCDCKYISNYIYLNLLVLGLWTHLHSVWLPWPPRHHSVKKKTTSVSNLWVTR